ncbi:hypothetical protein P3T37_001950 [Kitasatospora sp. MAA4]|uniref:DUF2752 domain-containing protein n=1 Tax=Kitasatospora sp. MAA4 TaxID=3035093 RepID=UPI002476A14C|nr:DUF2752 domain-containing protein [Kitasatospora sp. MAA4]MDH6132565.1 hypothetical protein [Kitasatospora sp. MAA4]
MTASRSSAGELSALRRLARPFGALAAVALPTLYVSAVDPNTPGHYPTCPFLQATGWWCPGCGGLRCVHALSRGDLTAACHDNLLAVALFGVLGVLWVRWAWAALTDGAPPRIAFGLRGTVALLALLVAFTVFRNLPGGAGLAPPLV